MKRETSILRVKGEIKHGLKPHPKWYLGSKSKLKGFCIWCGEPLPKRKRSYCSSDCAWWARCAIHDLSVTSVRRYMHRLFEFECQDCWKHFSRPTPAGVELPEHKGDVHHVIPLRDGGEDSTENMILLCNDCHKKRHKPKPPPDGE